MLKHWQGSVIPVISWLPDAKTLAGLSYPSNFVASLWYTQPNVMWYGTTVASSGMARKPNAGQPAQNAGWGSRCIAPRFVCTSAVTQCMTKLYACVPLRPKSTRVSYNAKLLGSRSLVVHVAVAARGKTVHHGAER